jgi:hypothetical protein
MRRKQLYHVLCIIIQMRVQVIVSSNLMGRTLTTGFRQLPLVELDSTRWLLISAACLAPRALIAPMLKMHLHLLVPTVSFQTKAKLLAPHA